MIPGLVGRRDTQLPRRRTTLGGGARAAAVLPAGAVAERDGAVGGVVALALLQAWVWTSSVVPKLTSSTFVHGFAGFVAQGSATGQSGWYDAFLQRVVLAAPSIFAIGAIAVELGLGVIFVVTALSLLTHRDDAIRRLLGAAAAASLVGAAFAINLALLVHDPAPWQAGSPFDSGVAVEYLIAGLSLAGALLSLALRRRLDRPRRS